MATAIDSASSFERRIASGIRRCGAALLALGLAVLPVPCAAADPPPGHAAPATPERLEHAIGFPLHPGPRTHGALSSASVRNLRLGFVLALEVVRGSPRCGALFASLGASGDEILASTCYAAPVNAPGARACMGGVAAFTTVGGRVTWLCPQFGSLHPRAAALTLVHEALHSAGMPESPSAAGALSAQEIDDVVEAACLAAPGSRAEPHVVARRH